jgi:hypothetical protein
MARSLSNLTLIGARQISVSEAVVVAVGSTAVLIVVATFGGSHGLV